MNQKRKFPPALRKKILPHPVDTIFLCKVEEDVRNTSKKFQCFLFLLFLQREKKRKQNCAFMKRKSCKLLFMIGLQNQSNNTKRAVVPEMFSLSTRRWNQKKNPVWIKCCNPNKAKRNSMTKPIHFKDKEKLVHFFLFRPISPTVIVSKRL